MFSGLKNNMQMFISFYRAQRFKDFKNSLLNYPIKIIISKVQSFLRFSEHDGIKSQCTGKS